MTPLALAGGSWWFLGFVVLFLLAVSYGYYTVKGSGINQHGWKDRDRVFGTGVGKDPTADVRNWSRGSDATRHHRRRAMTPLEERTAAAINASDSTRDPAWRARMSSRVQLVAPVDPATDHVRGPADAAVTLVEYGEYECSYCKEAQTALAELERRFGPALRLVFRHFPQTSVHPNARSAAVAAEAAGRQGRFWEMHEALTGTRKPLTPEHVAELARRVGVELDGAGAEEAEARIDADLRSGIESGVNGTPTIFLNNVRYDDELDPEELGAAIEAARATADRAGAGGVA